MAPQTAFTVVWSGVERRTYLGVPSHPVVVPEPRHDRRRATRPLAVRVSDAWLAGAHYRTYDSPKQRLFYSVQFAGAAFTIPELAIAAKVSRTLARRHVADMLAQDRLRPAGSLPAGRTRVVLFEVKS